MGMLQRAPVAGSTCRRHDHVGTPSHVSRPPAALPRARREEGLTRRRREEGLTRREEGARDRGEGRILRLSQLIWLGLSLDSCAREAAAVRAQTNCSTRWMETLLTSNTRGQGAYSGRSGWYGNATVNTSAR